VTRRVVFPTVKVRLSPNTPPPPARRGAPPPTAPLPSLEAKVALLQEAGVDVPRVVTALPSALGYRPGRQGGRPCPRPGHTWTASAGPSRAELRRRLSVLVGLSRSRRDVPCLNPSSLPAAQGKAWVHLKASPAPPGTSQMLLHLSPIIFTHSTKEFEPTYSQP